MGFGSGESAVTAGGAPGGGADSEVAEGGVAEAGGGVFGGVGGAVDAAPVEATAGAVDDASGGPALAAAGVGAGAGFFFAAASARRASTSLASVG